MTSAVKSPVRATIVPTGRWMVDPRHSSVEFAVKHLMIATIRGRFRNFEGALEVEDGSRAIRGHGVAKVESLDTGEPLRDHHLLSPDFFDLDAYPEIGFELEDAEPVAEDRYRVCGTITINGRARGIVFDAVVEGTALDPWGDERTALELTGELDRRDFGLSWNQPVGAGRMMIGDTVRVVLSLSLILQSREPDGRPGLDGRQGLQPWIDAARTLARAGLID